jgi:uncharacterized damage-inducible protein DinB
MVQRFHRLFAYDDWANREALASLKAIAAPPPPSLRFLGHIIGAEWLWLGRLRMQEKPAVVWPELALDVCAAQLADLSRAWRGYLAGLTPEALAGPTAYINSKGESWTSTVEDILMHVIMHSAYHRGQIATDLRASGHDPPYTDFIHAIRQGFVERPTTA